MSSILFTVSSRKFSPSRSVEDVDGIVVFGLILFFINTLNSPFQLQLLLLRFVSLLLPKALAACLIAFVVFSICFSVLSNLHFNANLL